MKGFKEVMKAFFVSNGDETKFRPPYFWVTLIMIGLIAAIIIELAEGKGTRVPLIGTLIGSAGILLGIYNWRKVHDQGGDQGGANGGKG